MGKLEFSKINKEKISLKEKEAINRLLQLSEYDFSEFLQTDVNENGIYEYSYFEEYFIDDKRNIFIVKVDGKFAGFAFVNNIPYVLKQANVNCIAEFFILKKYRRGGIGKQFAFHIFDSLNGTWELFQHEKNQIAIKFWKSIISEYTNDNYQVIKTTNHDKFEGQVIIFKKNRNFFRKEKG